MEKVDVQDLKKQAYHIRRHIVQTIATNGEGHAGGALSVADILAVLLFGVMNFSAEDEKGRDKLLLSAGHKCLALYAALVQKGVLKEEQLKTYNRLDTIFPGHPDSTKIPAVDFSTGSLGHGLPLGCGYALSAKRLGMPYKTYVVMGDGEQGEGSNWEAAGFASHKCLDNLIAVLDENQLQINGRTREVCKQTPFEQRYEAFGWAVRTVDGHDIAALFNVLSQAPFENGKPSMIVAKTVKGKGLSMLEGDVKYHHWNPDKKAADQAVKELEDYGKEKGWL